LQARTRNNFHLFIRLIYTGVKITPVPYASSFYIYWLKKQKLGCEKHPEKSYTLHIYAVAFLQKATINGVDSSVTFETR